MKTTTDQTDLLHGAKSRNKILYNNAATGATHLKTLDKIGSVEESVCHEP